MFWEYNGVIAHKMFADNRVIGDDEAAGIFNDFDDDLDAI